MRLLNNLLSFLQDSVIRDDNIAQLLLYTSASREDAMTLHQCTTSLLLLALTSATINLTDVNDVITVVDQLDPDRLKGVWFEAIVSALLVPEYCTVYECELKKTFIFILIFSKF